MLRRRTTMFLCVIVCAFVVSSCEQGSRVSPGTSPDEKPTKKGPVLAKVGGATITVEEFENELRSLPEHTQQRMRTGEQKKKHLDKMIDEILLLGEAERRGLARDEEIRQKVERYRKRLITEKLYREVAKEKSRVGEEEIQEYFQANKDRFVQKERIRVRQILILLPANAGPEKEAEAKKKAEDVRSRIEAGGDFAELAKEYSEGPAASRGGDLGYFSRGRMVPGFEEAAFALEMEGDTSDVLRTKFGYHIIQLTGRQPAKELSIDEVRDRIVRQLESVRRREVRQTLAKELRQQGNVEIREGYFEEEAPSKGEDPDA
jgi:peptidyl-prolyl cis-trans isomerase C